MNVFRWLRRLKADRVRHIPESYLRGYRRLAPTADSAEPGKCWSCKHAIGFVTWHCELHKKGKPCSWERCYVADELTKADLKAGDKIVGGWVGLPSRLEQ